ncbi:MAG: hypothetical protein ACK5LL_17510 [Suipraeoptans sp.]
MNPNEIIIYGFRLGNAHPEFKDFIRSLNNNEIHNLRKIMYEQKLDRYRDGYGRAIYGLDRYGCVNIPTTIRDKKWEEAESDIYTYLKELWVSVKLGYDGKGFNPAKNIQWKYWRALVVTSNEEAKEMIFSTAIEVGVQYLFSIGFITKGTAFFRPAAKEILKDGQQLLSRDLFNISYRITNPGKYGVGVLRQGQMDVGHRASTFFSDEVIKTGRIGIRDYKTIYFNKTIGDQPFSVGVNPWTRRIFHEGPGVFK